MNIGTAKDKESLTLRLKRIEGQLRGIQKMIAADADCEHVAQQFAAARKSLDRAFYALVACTLEHELGDEVKAKPRVRGRIEEIAALMAKFA